MFLLAKKGFAPDFVRWFRKTVGRLNNQVQHLVKVLRWETNTNN